MIQLLIDKQDNFEIIRDQVAAILTLESANQQILAAEAAKDPDDWKLNVYTERSNPWDQWVTGSEDQTPIVNVFFDNSTFDGAASNISERQKSETIINIDCYGRGISADIPEGGHVPGDYDAAITVQRAVRLVRNMLMAGEYTYLGLRGLVWKRWPVSISSFQPRKIDGQYVEQVIGTRISLKVEFNEFSPQYVGDTLEYIAIEIHRAEDGLIIVEADYDYTA